jgi:hypothetical protein
MYLEECIEKVNKKLDVLDGKRCIAIWGASENTVRIFQYTSIFKYNIKLIIDNGKHGSIFWGKTVVASDEVKWDVIDAVVISAFYKEDEIFDELTTKYRFHGTIVRLKWEGQKRPFYQHLMKSELQVPSEYKNVIEDNAKFYNLHKGKRCFVLCTGSSVRYLDLKKLKGEYSIAVSNFYMHQDYNIVKPSIYCMPQLTYTDKFTKELGKKHLEKVEQEAGDTQFFFSISERDLIEENLLYRGKRVNYLYFTPMGQEYEEVDLTLKTMGVYSVPIMCLELAIYMGFQEIYLVGTEHGELTKGRYDYFYNRKDNMVGHADDFIGMNGDIISYERVLPCIFRLWEQYKIMREIATQKGINIYNATRGGQLDVFDRVDYDTLF